MTDSQGTNPSQNPQGANPWANQADAPPPFPQTGTPYNAGHNPYPTGPYQGASMHRDTSHDRRTSADDRMWAMIAHLSAPIATVVSAGWLNIVGPLVVYLVKKDSSGFVRNASAGAFNFMLTTWLLSIVGWLLTITLIGAVVGIPMIIIGALGSIVLGIVGAIKSWNGEAYTYPWQIKVLS
ncbi:MAG: DUF4870 domain-containing protein [Propionibacteriaceae bacterium]|nr:DUF4870 domain-containing protein [Propionibacteriaceae bacterium]